MLRWAFSISTLVSLVLSVALVVMWVRSHWMPDCLDWRETTHENGKCLIHVNWLGSANGAISLTTTHHITTDLLYIKGHPPARGWSIYRTQMDTALVRSVWQQKTGAKLGFGWGEKQWTEQLHRTTFAAAQRVIMLPYWALVAATALLPALWLRGTGVRTWRAVHGQCPNCGYDLRATPDRCPECGAVALSAAD